MKAILYKYGHILTSEEQEFAFKKLFAEATKKKIPHNIQAFSLANTATLISLFKNYSGRALTSLIFPATDPRHNNQMNGRDVKRWAAEVLGELPEAQRSWAN